MTLEEIARYLSTSRSVIQRYENGIIKNIPYDKIERLAELFDVNPSYVLGWEEGGD